MMRLFEKRIKIEKARPLEENELNLILGATADEYPLWRAIMQLIDVAEDNANENASSNMDPLGALAGYVGGAAHLRMLREELYNRREVGRQLREQDAAKPRSAWD